MLPYYPSTYCILMVAPNPGQSPVNNQSVALLPVPPLRNNVIPPSISRGPPFNDPRATSGRRPAPIINPFVRIGPVQIAAANNPKALSVVPNNKQQSVQSSGRSVFLVRKEQPLSKTLWSPEQRLEIVTIDTMLSKLTFVCCVCPILEAARRELSNASREYKETVGIPVYSMSSPVGGVAFYSNMAAGL
jgi:hypothetical protein